MCGACSLTSEAAVLSIVALLIDVFRNFSCCACCVKIMAGSAIAQLHATALTTRCHNSFFRQKQLKSLHDALRQNSNTIKDAIKSDTRVSEQEATAEVALSLDLVKEHYASINPSKELEEEYRLSKGQDAQDQTKPWGVVYIEPQQNHTPFFSIITALSAALAAGNCVALKVSLKTQQF